MALELALAGAEQQLEIIAPSVSIIDDETVVGKSLASHDDLVTAVERNSPASCKCDYLGILDL
ncbi:hypothetical protein TorRG33x02_220120 [Trema orientale]|uniref:Uncharacterized protein n=1 Tax=Trema orientale TaxID=63057 RepID=A0A2P5E9M7_TREOI|nr:hypothetical protein TorRG33x02_220120 [Trema orientale]